VKLPPMALTAPRVCPRCDAPAVYDDHCGHCSLQLRQCGACQGISGPFDRHCGFCGHEILLGRKRSPAWRLWLVAALVPLLAGIGFGLSPLNMPAAGAVGRILGGGAQIKLEQSQHLGFSYARPPDWFATDYSQEPARNLPLIVVHRLTADDERAATANGDLLLVKPEGAVVALGRPALDAPGADPKDPAAVLAVQVGQLVTQPPSGVKIEVVRAAHSINVDHRAGAEVVLRVTQGGTTYYYERAYLAAPKGSRTLLRVDAEAPTVDWEGGDDRRVEALIQSLRFS
jgi:hypothetical protein